MFNLDEQILLMNYILYDLIYIVLLFLYMYQCGLIGIGLYVLLFLVTIDIKHIYGYLDQEIYFNETLIFLLIVIYILLICIDISIVFVILFIFYCVAKMCFRKYMWYENPIYTQFA